MVRKICFVLVKLTAPQIDRTQDLASLVQVSKLLYKAALPSLYSSFVLKISNGLDPTVLGSPETFMAPNNADHELECKLPHLTGVLCTRLSGNDDDGECFHYRTTSPNYLRHGYPGEIALLRLLPQLDFGQLKTFRCV